MGPRSNQGAHRRRVGASQLPRSVGRGSGRRDDSHLGLDLLGRGDGGSRLDQTGFPVPAALGASETPLLSRQSLLRLDVLALSFPESLRHEFRLLPPQLTRSVAFPAGGAWAISPRM